MTALDPNRSRRGDARPPLGFRPTGNPPEFRPAKPRSSLQPFKQQRYPWVTKEPKQMTIVAGFRVQDGILLCSDTQYTGAEKVNKQKLFPTEIQGDSYVFALAGHEGNAKMAIEECQESIAAIPPEHRTRKSVRKALRLAIKPIVDEYVLTRPSEQQESLAFELLVGCWIPRGGGHNLFSFGRTGAVNSIHTDYECCGQGSYLARYLINPSYYFHMSLEDVMIVAADMLRCAKLYDATCGGHSSFAIIDRYGKYQSVLYDFFSTEKSLADFDLQTKSLLYCLAPHQPDEDFESRLDLFVKAIRVNRMRWKAMHENHAMFARASMKQAARDPQPSKDDLSAPQPSPE